MSAVGEKFERCVQINLQQSLGGGEIYTAAVGRAMARLGLPSVIVGHANAGFWTTLDTGGAELLKVGHPAEIAALDFPARTLYIVHAGLDGAQLTALKCGGGKVAAFAHLPYHERSPAVIAHADLVCAVSGYVLSTLREKGVSNVFPEPFFGVADLARRASASTEALQHRNEFDWDRRKFRDRLFSLVYPAIRRLIPTRFYRKPNGITLGVVSRITTIKQFPELFSLLTPILQEFPEFHVAVFGQGGYKSVRDLKRALAPLGDRVSYWGHQSDVQSVYRSIDWLLSGLPEKEALGLNIIEAQFCGVPVLAVDAPPFRETVADGVTGYLYTDPRLDRGAGFRAKLAAIRQSAFRRDEARAAEHLALFSEAALARRFAHLIAAI